MKYSCLILLLCFASPRFHCVRPPPLLVRVLQCERRKKHHRILFACSRAVQPPFRARIKKDPSASSPPSSHRHRPTQAKGGGDAQRGERSRNEGDSYTGARAGGGGGSFVYTPHQPLRLAVPGRAPLPSIVVLLLVKKPSFSKAPPCCPPCRRGVVYSYSDLLVRATTRCIKEKNTYF